MFEEISRYPLHYPEGYRRTPSHKQQRARFEVTFAKARDELLRELELLGASLVVISSNIPRRSDGLPYAKYKQPEDPGVAVYFQLNQKPHVLACDRWDLVKDNLRAIGLHVAAMRGQMRWGVGSVEQAFMGYQALPPVSDKHWWVVLQVSQDATASEIKTAYRKLARVHHPDANGDGYRMQEINRAYSEAMKVKSK